MSNTYDTPLMAATAAMPPTSSVIPLAGRLAKLKTLPFGRTKWQSRFFILLNSELRIYKDEFADTPCDTLSLHHIKTILPLAIGPQANCLRLEPYMPHEKALTLACPSEHDRGDWLNAIHLRLEKSKPDIQLQTNATKPSPPSLSRRRGIMLAPLTIRSDSVVIRDDDKITLNSVPGFSSSSSSSYSSSVLFCSSPSPPPSYFYQRSMSVPTVITSLSSSSAQLQDGETSPSFLKYKQQFHL